jgi:PST family polysaccharide transporter
LLATLVFSPWVIRILYSARFGEAADLLPWFVLGVFGRVVSWPLGFIMLAKGAARWFAVSELVWAFLHLFFIWYALQKWGLKGVGMAFAALYFCYTGGVLWIARHLTFFCWTAQAVRLLVEASAAAAATFMLVWFGPLSVSTAVGAPLVFACGLVCLRRICLRLGKEHRLTLWVGRIPGVGPWLLD